MKANNKTPNPGDEECLDLLVRRAMVEKGMLPPMTEEEVEIVEKLFPPEPNKVEFAPFDEIWKRFENGGQDRISNERRSRRETEATENLARAAREGGEITDEIRSKMERDRQADEIRGD